MKIIQNQTFDSERALYNTKDTLVESCTFAGPKDGESALKECRDIKVNHCSFSLRYCMWHDIGFNLTNSVFKSPSRASLWYCSNGHISNTKFYSVKAIRECDMIEIDNCYIDSIEFAWKCRDIKLTNSQIVGTTYPFLDSKNIELNNVKLEGKYSFQYVENVVINRCELVTKDAFWHAKNVTVTNSVVKSEYLGWYSDGLTLINCKIIGTQPLCYCKNLKLVDCEMVDSNLSFEYSEVDASIKGYIESIKNPKSGVIRVDKVGAIIKDNPVMECHADIIIKK